MSYLKPEHINQLTKLSFNYGDVTDIRMLVNCLSMGDYASGGKFYLNKFRYFHYKKAYEVLPKIVKYTLSECNFNSIIFPHDNFYTHGVDINEVYKDYCEYFLKYGEYKKIRKFYNNLKKNNPELFI